jgi:hypothetical protein
MRLFFEVGHRAGRGAEGSVASSAAVVVLISIDGLWIC